MRFSFASPCLLDLVYLFFIIPAYILFTRSSLLFLCLCSRSCSSSSSGSLLGSRLHVLVWACESCLACHIYMPLSIWSLTVFVAGTALWSGSQPTPITLLETPELTSSRKKVLRRRKGLSCVIQLLHEDICVIIVLRSWGGVHTSLFMSCHIFPPQWQTDSLCSSLLFFF